MNSILLPNKEELISITNERSTFYECGFNKTFDSLNFQKKLEIVNDIIRQTIFPTSRPNPQNHTQTLIGNCHTATLVAIEYLKFLDLGKNYKYVMGRVRPFEKTDITTTHALIFVDDEFGETYQFDATPYVGYKYGAVSLLKKEKFYLDYEEIDEKKLEIINEIRNLILYDYEGLINETNINYYKNIIFEAMNYKILDGYTSQCAKLLSKYETNKYDKDRMIKISFEFNPYERLNSDNKNLINENDKIKLRQINIWKNELEELKLSNNNIKRQLELAQMIVQELKFIDLSYEKYLILKNEKIRFSHITPRFLYEKGLTSIMIKPSAYFTNTNKYVEEKICENANLMAGDYTCNLSLETKDKGIKPMLFSHTLGEEYIRSMNGISKILLVEKDVEKLYQIKKVLREELGKNLYYKEFVWYDGENILWHPFVTNYVHTADNPSESSLHYLIGFPEHQLMTRFMYPNKKLEKRK